MTDPAPVPTHAPTPVLTSGFAALAADYDLILSDVWGVVHNGVMATQEACDALERFRAGGGTVVLISNAPRPGDAVREHLRQLKVPASTHDGIVTSGDVTRALVAGRPGQSLYHLGPQRDASLFAGLDVAFAPAKSAEYVVCSGLFDDETETPDDYRESLGGMAQRRLTMICANPDIVVERGDRLLFCAGALAELYGEMGGEVIYTGKPHGPIYQQALAVAREARGKAVPPARVIAVGDSIRTDVTGADANGLDCVFVTAGIHAEELGGHDTPDMARLRELFATAGVAPRAVMRRLRW